jgi:3-deoxy-D-arabino-heptulosonate 7-phosphate (DAHP) synthase
MLICGPCLLNDDPLEMENTIETAKQLHAIDPSIMFRCKVFGGGTIPEKYFKGINTEGLYELIKIKETIGLKIGTEIRDTVTINNDDCSRRDPAALINDHFNFVWIAARACQNYELLEYIKDIKLKIFIKRNPGITIDEVIGIHDICRDIHGYKPIMIERGINTFCRTDKRRWMPDFQGMLRLLTERPDIELMFDPSHACGQKEDIFPMVKAAYAIGVKHFMLEVYADPTLTKTDKAQALSIDEFRTIYDIIKQCENKCHCEKLNGSWRG